MAEDTTSGSPTKKCELCGEPMPPGEEMFNYHGYSGLCPAPPLPKPKPPQDDPAALEAALKWADAGCATCALYGDVLASAVRGLQAKYDELLANARGAAAADAERENDAATKAGVPFMGCDTLDMLAEAVLYERERANKAEAEVAALKDDLQATAERLKWFETTGSVAAHTRVFQLQAQEEALRAEVAALRAQQRIQWSDREMDRLRAENDALVADRDRLRGLVNRYLADHCQPMPDGGPCDCVLCRDARKALEGRDD